MALGFASGHAATAFDMAAGIEPTPGVNYRVGLNMRGQLIDDPEPAMSVADQQEPYGIAINHRSRFKFPPACAADAAGR